MLSTPVAAALARRDVHYGWVIAGVTFLTMLVTAAAMGAPGVLIVPLEKEFGWSTSEISAALALRLVLFGLLGPFAAALMNRFGLRRVIVCALVLISAGFIHHQVEVDNRIVDHRSVCFGVHITESHFVVEEQIGERVVVERDAGRRVNH